MLLLTLKREGLNSMGRIDWDLWAALVGLEKECVEVEALLQDWNTVDDT